MYDNYNFLAIGYCTTTKTSDCFVSLAAASNGLSLSFYYGATLPDPHHILLGSGNQNRFVRIPDVSLLTTAPIEALLNAAVAQATHPLAAEGRGTTIIKSVSAKQRPRRALHE